MGEPMIAWSQGDLNANRYGRPSEGARIDGERDCRWGIGVGSPTSKQGGGVPADG